MSTTCTVIAEAGVNHNGSFEMAIRMIDTAKASGADWVKFQTFQADKLVTRNAPMAAYQKAAVADDSPYQMLKKLELPLEAFRDLAQHCKTVGIAFLSTPFDVESAEYLAKIGMTALKVPSGEITNLPLLRAFGNLGLPVILSTGMATLGEVEAAVEVLEKAGVAPAAMTILHCTTEYPAPPEEVNLKAMLTLRTAFPDSAIGYSDHTQGIDISVAAVALGASMIEKHFTLDRSLPGPDHKASLEPGELKALTDAVFRVEHALGDGRKRPTASELPNRIVARKSIFAARDIGAGETFSEGNLAIRRPGNGKSPMLWDELVGSVAARSYAAGDPI